MCGEGEDVRGPSDAAGGAGAAVPSGELIKVKPELTDAITEPLDKIDTGTSTAVGLRIVRVL